MNPLKQVIGDHVKRLRIAKGWSQSDLARRSGFDESYIGVVERGQANPSLSTLDAVAEALGVEAYQLLRYAESNVD